MKAAAEFFNYKHSWCKVCMKDEVHRNYKAKQTWRLSFNGRMRSRRG